jgi:hypothetical protein
MSQITNSSRGTSPVILDMILVLSELSSMSSTNYRDTGPIFRGPRGSNNTQMNT